MSAANRQVTHHWTNHASDHTEHLLTVTSINLTTEGGTSHTVRVTERGLDVRARCSCRAPRCEHTLAALFGLDLHREGAAA